MYLYHPQMPERRSSFSNEAKTSDEEAEWLKIKSDTDSRTGRRFRVAADGEHVIRSPFPITTLEF